jgi:hypothetical protein
MAAGAKTNFITFFLRVARFRKTGQRHRLIPLRLRFGARNRRTAFELSCLNQRFLLAHQARQFSLFGIG